jgi:hypothetical protein
MRKRKHNTPAPWLHQSQLSPSSSQMLPRDSCIITTTSILLKRGYILKGTDNFSILDIETMIFSL